MSIEDLSDKIGFILETDDNEMSKDHLFIEKIESYIFQQTPEQKTELFNINCNGVDVDGFLIKEDIVRLTYIDYDTNDHGSNISSEVLDKHIEEILKIKEQFSSVEELSRAIDTEEPIYEVYEAFLSNPDIKIEILILTNKVINRMTEMMIKGLSIEYGYEMIYYDYNKINRILSQSIHEQTETIDFTNYNIETVSISQDNTDVYLFMLPTDILANLYDEYGTVLLQDNVRLFLKTSGVNKGIKKTLTEEPGLFLSYNNGLSAVCKDIVIEDGKIKSIVGLQIVNGGQTTASLHDALVSKINMENSFVQVKLSHVKNIDNYDTLVTNIARYANTQNKVNNSDFVSAHSYFIEFEKIASKEKIPAVDHSDFDQKIFFERMRGQQKILLGKISKKQFDENYLMLVDIKKIAQIENIWNGHPAQASKGGEKSLQFFLSLVENKSISVEEYRNIISRQLIVKRVEEVMELSTAPGNRYKTTSRSKNFGPIASTIKYYSLYLIFEKLKKEKTDLSNIYMSKTAENHIVDSEIIIFIEKAFNFFDNMKTEINMIARSEETQSKFITELI